MSHYNAALYTARRLEMCEIVEMTLFYFLDRPQVHSPLSGLPFMVSGYNDCANFLCMCGLLCAVSYFAVYDRSRYLTSIFGTKLVLGSTGVKFWGVPICLTLLLRVINVFLEGSPTRHASSRFLFMPEGE